MCSSFFFPNQRVPIPLRLDRSFPSRDPFSNRSSWAGSDSGRACPYHFRCNGAWAPGPLLTKMQRVVAERRRVQKEKKQMAKSNVQFRLPEFRPRARPPREKNRFGPRGQQARASSAVIDLTIIFPLTFSALAKFQNPARNQSANSVRFGSGFGFREQTTEW